MVSEYFVVVSEYSAVVSEWSVVVFVSSAVAVSLFAEVFLWWLMVS